MNGEFRLTKLSATEITVPKGRFKQAGLTVHLILEVIQV